MVGTNYEAGFSSKSAVREELEVTYDFGEGMDQAVYRKSTFLAFLLWLPPFGILGFHRAYVGHWWHAMWYTLTLGNLGLGWLFDLCRLSAMIDLEQQSRRAGRTLYSSCDTFALWLGPAGFLGAHRGLHGHWVHQIYYFLTGAQLGMAWLIDMCLLTRITRHGNAKGTDREEEEGARYSLLDAYILQLPPAGLLGAARFYCNSDIGAAWLLTGGNCGLGWLADFVRLPWLMHEAKQHDAQLRAWRESDIESTQGYAASNFYRPKRELSMFDTYLLWLPPLGLLGAHKFYTGRHCWGVIYLFTGGLFTIGWIYDFFTLPCQVNSANDGKRLYRVLSNEYMAAMTVAQQPQEQQQPQQQPQQPQYHQPSHYEPATVPFAPRPPMQSLGEKELPSAPSHQVVYAAPMMNSQALSMPSEYAAAPEQQQYFVAVPAFAPPPALYNIPNNL